MSINCLLESGAAAVSVIKAAATITLWLLSHQADFVPCVWQNGLEWLVVFRQIHHWRWLQNFRSRLNRHHFTARRLHSLDHDRGHAFEKLVPERTIAFTIFAQNCSVEENRRRRLDSARRQTPRVWRKHPRPPQQFACADRIDDHRIRFSVARFEYYFSGFDQIKA